MCFILQGMKCPAGSKYSEKMTGCPETCQGVPDTCDLDDTEGCECEKGWVMSGTKCVKRSECGCTHQDGTYMQVCMT